MCLGHLLKVKSWPKQGRIGLSPPNISRRSVFSHVYHSLADGPHAATLSHALSSKVAVLGRAGSLTISKN